MLLCLFRRFLRPVSLLFARALKFRFALSETSGIIRFRARVAEWQTRRSQKPLSKDVRVQISPRAPAKYQAPFWGAFLLQALSCSQVFPDERKIINGTLRNIANFQERSDALHSYKQARHDAQAERGTEGKGAILCEDAKAHAQHHPGQRSDEERRESLLEIEE